MIKLLYNNYFFIKLNTLVLHVIKFSTSCLKLAKLLEKSHVWKQCFKSLNRTKRRFDVNLIKKRFFIPDENKWITLKISASALKTINKKVFLKF